MRDTEVCLINGRQTPLAKPQAAPSRDLLSGMSHKKAIFYEGKKRPALEMVLLFVAFSYNLHFLIGFIHIYNIE